MHRWSTLLQALSACFIALQIAIGCSTNDEAPGGPASPSVSVMIPASGGRIVSSDGRASLQVPPGALDGDTVIHVRVLPRTPETRSDIYDFGPDGLVFKVPARLEITASSVDLAGEVSIAMTHGQGWTALPSVIDGVMDSTMGRASADVAHFTGFGIIGGTPPSTLPGDGGSGDGGVGPGGPAVRVITGGSAHTCYITPSGGVRCWGGNGSGAVGIGSDAIEVLTPTDVPGVSGAIALALGPNHSCALIGDGTVKCWGSNTDGQLGANVGGSSRVPVAVAGLQGATAIDVVENRTCVLVGTTLKCWGALAVGDLPAWALTDKMAVPFLPKGFSVGPGFTCFIDASNVVHCTAGAPGLTEPSAMSAAGLLRDAGPDADPLAGAINYDAVGPVPGLPPSSHVVTSTNKVCVVDLSGAVLCLVASAPGGSPAIAAPVLMRDGSPLSNVIALATSGHGLGTSRHTCALQAQGAVACWGNNLDGQCGADDVTWTTDAIPIPNVAGATAVGAGRAHTCAAMGTAIKCWGSNQASQLGGKPKYGVNPEEVSGLGAGVQKVAASQGITCAITASGGAKCWGRYLLGNGNAKGSGVPVDVVGLGSGVTSISLGPSMACAAQSGATKCWGSSLTGGLGGSVGQALVPVDIPGVASGVVAVSAGANHGCAMFGTGNVKCWGQDKFGQLGSGGAGTGGNLPATDVVNLNDAQSIETGGAVTCVRTAGGGARCWGAAVRLGTGSSNQDEWWNEPVTVPSLASGTASLAVGVTRTCAVTTGGVARCWGAYAGELSPADVASGVVSVSAGMSHTCYARSTGKVECFGENDSSQLSGPPALGSGKLPPVEVPGISDAVAVTVGWRHSCALTQAGKLLCWGLNVDGQLGNGRVPGTAAPIDIPTN